MKHVVILGSGDSIQKFNKSNHDGHEIWTMQSNFQAMLDNGITPTLVFCMHPNEKPENYSGEIIDLATYPLQEIKEEIDSSYFTNTISYMLAYAYHKKFDSISIYGVDMIVDSEYAFERPSVLYFIGYLRGKGIQVYISNYIDKPLFLYGFDHELTKKLLHRLNERKEQTINFIEYYKKNNTLPNADKKIDQYAGRYSEIKYWERELRS